MSAPADPRGLPPAKRRRLIGLGLARSLVTVVVLVVLYYVLPLDHIKNVAATLVVGLLILVAVAAWQLRAIIRARYPAVQAIEALAITLPLFLLLFASLYLSMANSSPGNFSVHSLTRTDALYFTVTVFSTVGFGDITATSQSARVVVIVQMLLDLLALGLVVRAFVSAVKLARQQPRTDGESKLSPRQGPAARASGTFASARAAAPRPILMVSRGAWEVAAVSDFFKLVTAGPLFFVSAWLLMIFAGIVGTDVGIRPFGYLTSMVVTIGLWLTLAPAVGAIARVGKNPRVGKKQA